MMNGADDLYDLDFLVKEDLAVFFTELKLEAAEVVAFNLQERSEEPMSFLNSLYN